MPVILKYQKDINENNLELANKKYSKKKKGESKEENNKNKIEIEENGCIIF